MVSGWILLALLHAYVPPREYYLTSRECEKSREKKVQPGDYACIPWDFETTTSKGTKP